MPFNLKSIFSAGAEKVVQAVGDAFDKNFTNKEEREAAKLKAIEEINRNLEAMQAAALKEYELENQDRASARGRETEFVKATGHVDYMQIFVGVVIMLSFFAALIIIGYKAIPAGNEHIMINAIGILEGLVLSVAGYYYGSSMGSRLKDMKKGA